MKFNCSTPSELLKEIKDLDVKMVDMRFTDMPGTTHHFTIPIKFLNEDIFEDGLGFDGSSVRGFQAIENSDMIVIPDVTTAYIDPFFSEKTIVFYCDIKDPITKESYTRDPRNIAKKAEGYLKTSGIGDTAFFGPEAEFFIFNDVKYDSGSNFAFHEVDSSEGTWNTGKEEGPNLGHKPRHKEGYFPLPPVDSMHDVRTEMVMTMQDIGLTVEAHHHEVATGGQQEIDLEFAPLVSMADDLMKYKYVVKNVAKLHGLSATFMPKPLFGDNGSGMHVHQSVWKDGDTLMYKKGNYADLSDLALHYIGGILKHAPALLAFCAPTTNSYKRLVPGFEAPVNIAYSQRNRTASVRIPTYSSSPKSKRMEFRCPDPSANPYLAFAAMLMAGLDGVKNKIDPGEPTDINIYEAPEEILAKIPSTPGSLAEALNALESDHAFLLEGDVFTKDVIETYVNYKRENEVNPVNIQPHPHEFKLYYDA
ncbi:MAG: type I glutamate--ammonia ligase [Proteobacteria bacterium]|nr:type I glutamate--ammonia ligase [Alphaproteobacteria bacterium]MDA1181226.1 type I glutamate--ammonia ligase [Pseudomonadota bacterium]